MRTSTLDPSPLLDLILSLIYCSALSYRNDSLITPFPDGFEDVNKLISWLEELKLNQNSISVPEGFINWFSNFSTRFSLFIASSALFERETGLKALNKNIPKPHYILKLKRTPNSVFDELEEVHGVEKGFHGTHTENVYNIINNGFLGNLNRRSLFGEGTYLSSDLAVALSFSKVGVSWPSSLLGSNMLCVLQCDVVKSDQVRRGVSKLSGISLDTQSLPHNYFVVKNDDHVRVTHVLVYVRKSSSNTDSWYNGMMIFLRSYWIFLVYIVIFVVACFQTKRKNWTFDF